MAAPLERVGARLLERVGAIRPYQLLSWGINHTHGGVLWQGITVKNI